MRPTWPLLRQIPFPPLRRAALETLQVNLGYRCNQQCLHCHVAAGPHRREMMDRGTAELVLAFLERSGASTLDLTGGAPELNPHFRFLVREARARGVRVLDRCNLTVLEEPGQEDLAEFLAEQQVEVVASLPCYLEENVDRQRGRGVFEASLRALRRLNALGYGAGEGRGEGTLALHLVYNPQGPVLPPPQAELEAAYRERLRELGVVFDRLLTLANMPIRRFGSMLLSQGRFHAYLELLQASHRPENLEGVMCRRLLSVDWRGRVYDCDFNQMLGLPLGGAREPVHLRRLLEDPEALRGRPVAVGGHCYGCTAGQGSSCGGALQA